MKQSLFNNRQGVANNSNNNLSNFHYILRVLIHDYGYSIALLAAKTQLSKCTFYRLAKGNKPNAETFRKLLTIYCATLIHGKEGIHAIY